ncbi:MAG: hypothetical protein K8R54_01625 [Bacteroidales bacterium]|nr:hypothetical protein [Bacteroidales bacterium]
MKKFLKVTCLVLLSMSLFMSCAKKDILPEEDITVKESSENYEKGDQDDRRVRLYYDDYGIKSAATTALSGALSAFNSKFGENFYISNKNYWSHNGNFDDIYDAHDHLYDNYRFDDYYAVVGFSNKITNLVGGNLGTQAKDHCALDYKRLSVSSKRLKSCALHEFVHCIPNCRSNCNVYWCVMSTSGILRGSTRFCVPCQERINANL